MISLAYLQVNDLRLELFINLLPESLKPGLIKLLHLFLLLLFALLLLFLAVLLDPLLLLFRCFNHD